jgi:copper transport protein
VAIVASGTVQAWRQLGSLGAVTSTSYGRILLVKVAVVAVVVGFAAVSRRVVQRRLSGGGLVARPAGPGTDSLDPDVETLGRLRRSVGIELGLSVVVLALAAMLVQAAPARAVAEGPAGGVDFGNVAPGAPTSAPYAATLKAGKSTVIVTGEPARTGTNQFHFTILDPGSQLQEVEEFSAQLSLASQGLGPINLPMQKLGPGHYTAANVLLPLGGDWRLKVSVRTSDIDEYQASTSVRIR